MQRRAPAVATGRASRQAKEGNKYACGPCKKNGRIVKKTEQHKRDCPYNKDGSKKDGNTQRTFESMGMETHAADEFSVHKSLRGDSSGSGAL